MTDHNDDTDDIIDRVKDSAETEISAVSRTLPSLKAQLIKWAIRAALAYALARAFVTWNGGPDWVMPVTYIYMGLSLIGAIAIWFFARRMITKSLNRIEQKSEQVRQSLRDIDQDHTGD